MWITKEGEKMKLSIKKLKIAMARMKFNLSDLEKASSIKKCTLSAYLSGRIQPSLKSLGIIATALKVDVTEIIEE